jgi:LPS-assembly lipoprotein
MSRDGWSISSSEAQPLAGRRGLLRGLAGLGALAAGGCGFRPLYAPNAAGAPGIPTDVAAELASVRVPLMRERFGQLTRRSLEQRLAAGTTLRPAQRYELRMAPALLLEGTGIDRSGSATRVRYLATARWTLVRLGPPDMAVASGFERSLDSFNVPVNQYFATDATREATEQRLADALAGEVVLRVVVAMRRVMAGLSDVTPVPAPDATDSIPAELQPPGPVNIAPPGPSTTMLPL